LIHLQGHTTASKQVLSAYLPGSGGGPYSEGGSLMALGLIHANRFNIEIRQYLLEQLKNAQTYCPQNYEPLQHGACIGLGLLGMGSNDEGAMFMWLLKKNLMKLFFRNFNEIKGDFVC
jgi:26S proteasome regulatory subunit N2